MTIPYSVGGTLQVAALVAIAKVKSHVLNSQGNEGGGPYSVDLIAALRAGLPLGRAPFPVRCRGNVRPSRACQRESQRRLTDLPLRPDSPAYVSTHFEQPARWGEHRWT